jgi:hypothetical protein
MKTFVRVIYNGVGIYEALKQNVTKEEWSKILKEPGITWLPKPSIEYSPNNVSLFTMKGIVEYKAKSEPIILKYLDSKKIEYYLYIVKDSANVVYEDKYQVVIQLNDSSTDMIGIPIRRKSL